MARRTQTDRYFHRPGSASARLCGYLQYSGTIAVKNAQRADSQWKSDQQLGILTTPRQPAVCTLAPGISEPGVVYDRAIADQHAAGLDVRMLRRVEDHEVAVQIAAALPWHVGRLRFVRLPRDLQ